MFLLIVIFQLLSARYTRNRNRFVTAPTELNVNAQNHLLVHAALTAGLYPKILSIDSKSGQLRTITNNQAASFHPSSVNFGRNPTDFGTNHLMYFTLMCALIF
jgi:ATP-dependent RNA helicase DHX29